MVTEEDVKAAAARINGHVRRTPVLELLPGELGLNGPTVLKLEGLQRIGAFKARGAFNFLLAAELPPAGVVAASGGNHAAAVALAARELNCRARVYMPANASRTKLETVWRLAAEVVLAGKSYAEARAAATDYARESGALDIPAFDHPLIIAGQGTVGLEFASQAAMDTLLVAVGGGGLAAGCAVSLGAATRLVTVETLGSSALSAALRAGRPVDVDVGGVVSDSLGARSVGELPFAILQDRVAESILIDDRAVRETQRRLWEECRFIAEPGGATALAALICGAYRPKPAERVGVIVCGSNCAPGFTADAEGK